MSSISLFDELFGTSPFPASGEVSEADALTNHAECADDESSQTQGKEDCATSQKRKWFDFTDGSDDSGSTFPSSFEHEEHNGKVIKFKDEHLDLQCEWCDCDYRTCNLDHFVRHVSLHIPHPEVKDNEDQEGGYVCLWGTCGFKSVDFSELMRHVNFHSYHTKLKSIGSNILARSKLPVCTLHNTGRNVIPDLSHAFECCWNTCEQTFNSLQTYFIHVATHVNCNPHGRNMNGGVPCHWRGCKSVVCSINKLADHIRRHTREKLVGCPSCGGLFASRTKFSDHCKRQAPVELHEHQCPHCSKCYPSQKLLRDHARCHINHYKCPHCDKTCPTLSSLRVHISYRHLDNRPFKCSFCEHRAKTSYDLKRHLNTHCSSPLYHCEGKGCGLSFRTASGLRKHCNKYHLGSHQPLYCCHICDNLFHRTSKLTHHLHAEHGICRPSGHCRFRYKQDMDGFFRLLIVHPQGVQVTQMVMKSKSGVIQPLCDSIPTVSDDDTGAGGSRLLISAVELDSSGNTEASEKMETAE